MRRPWQILTATALILVSGAVLTAGRSADIKEAPVQQDEAQITVIPAEDGAPRGNVLTSPTLVAEMAEARDAYREQLARLTSQFQEAHDPVLAMELQREIEDLKMDTELGYLEIQARHARDLGQLDLATRAETLLASMRERVREQREARVSLTPRTAGEEKVDR